MRQPCSMLHTSSHYSKRWPFSASVNRISMRQFSVTLFIIHPPKKTRQLKLLLIAHKAIKKDFTILRFYGYNFGLLQILLKWNPSGNTFKKPNFEVKIAFNLVQKFVHVQFSIPFFI